MSIIKHGLLFFINEGIVCPECLSKEYRIDPLLRSNLEVEQNICRLRLTCKKCDCVWYKSISYTIIQEEKIECGDNCSCEKRAETWMSAEGRWLCQAQHCPHYFENGGCKLGKVSLTCDNNNCQWNKKVDGLGIYVCSCMDIHLDANGRCYSLR